MLQTWIGLVGLIVAIAGLLGTNYWQSRQRGKDRAEDQKATIRANVQQEERISFMKGEIIQLQANAQTQGERESEARAVHAEFTSHMKEDELKFNMIDGKLDKILAAVRGERE